MTDMLSIGFLPLTDCAVLVAAHERGFAAAEGLTLTLVRDTSWATARDRLVYGRVQAAHMLAPLAVAVSLGLGAYRVPLAAPFRLNVNGNQIVLSRALAGTLGIPAPARVADPQAAALALARVLRSQALRAGAGRAPVLGVVHRFSSHALTMRYWLASAGIDPDRDVELRVLPPSFTVEALVSGEIDGFCAGEPWGSIAVESGAAETVAVGARIWQGGVEKVLALRADWADAHPELTDRLLRALNEAAAWCDNAANHTDLAELLARPAYVDQPAAMIRRALDSRLRLFAGGPTAEMDDFMLFHRGATGFPWRSQALWIYAQFVRWGLAAPSAEAKAASSAVFRSDIYRRALAGRTPMPGSSARLEGALAAATPAGSDLGTLVLAPDRFFDNRVFDPDQIESYLAALPPRTAGLIHEHFLKVLNASALQCLKTRRISEEDGRLSNGGRSRHGLDSTAAVRLPLPRRAGSGFFVFGALHGLADPARRAAGYVSFVTATAPAAMPEPVPR